MNTPQNPSPNYDAILEQIKGLKTWLSVKETRLDLLVAQLKETRTELEATQTKLEANQRELEATQTGLQTIESELKATQSELRSTQSQLGTTQSELKSTQSQFATVPQELKATRKYTDDLLVGSVAAFAMPQAPEGWLICNGQEVSRTEYARLFTRIGTTFGQGDASTTFNLPDLRGVFVRGWDKSSERDPEREFGSYQADQMQSHTHQDSGHSHKGKTESAGSHRHDGHTDTAGNHQHDLFLANGSIYYPNSYFSLLNGRSAEWGHSNTFVKESGNHWHKLEIDSAGSHSHDLSISTSKASLGEPTASGAETVRHGSETRPQNVALLFCIKY